VRYAWVVAFVAACGRVGFDDPAPRFDAPRTVFYGEAANFPETMLETECTALGPTTRVADSDALDTVLPDADIVIVEALHSSHTAAEAHALSSWLETGGSLVVLTSYDASDYPPYQTLLSDYTFAFQNPIIDGPVTELAHHPTTAGVTSLVFMGGYAIAYDAHFADLGSISGQPVAAVGSPGEGRALVWGDEWVSFDKQWADDVPTFWRNVLAWLRHRS
jgi:hypothetical protein